MPMATRYIRAVDTYDVGGASRATRDGLTYATAWAPRDAECRAYLATPAWDEIYWCGPLLPAVTVPESGSTHNLKIHGGLSSSRPRIMRGDYPGDPGTIFGGAIDMACSWTDQGGNVWSSVMGIAPIVSPPTAGVGIFANWSASDGLCNWTLYVPDVADLSTMRVLSQVATLPECEATEDTFYLVGSTAGSTYYVHLKATETPSGHIVRPECGYIYRFHTLGNPLGSESVENLIHYKLGYYPTGRINVGGQTITTHQPSNITWRKSKVLIGGGALLPIQRCHDIVIDQSEWGYISDYGIVYCYYSNFEYDGTPVPDGIRHNDYAVKRLTVTQSIFRETGNTLSSTTDSHVIGIQGGDDHVITGNIISNFYSGVVLWAAANPLANMTDIRIEANHFFGMHDGAEVHNNNWYARAIDISSPEQGLQTGITIYGNTIDGPMVRRRAESAYVPFGVAGSRALVGNTTPVRNNRMRNIPGGINQRYAYVNAERNIVVDPAGHTKPYFAFAASGSYGATANLDENLYVGTVAGGYGFNITTSNVQEGLAAWQARGFDPNSVQV
jgi:hypothetical protein